jgi:dihydropteroate synthase
VTAGYNVRPLMIGSMGSAQESIRCIGCDPGGVPLMAPKAMHHTFKLEDVDSRAALIIKQEMLSAGGEAAVCRGVIGLSSKKTDILVMGTRRQLQLATGKLRGQPFGAAAVAEELRSVIRNMDRGRDHVIKWGGRRLELGKRTHVMGVLNVTPDSFSDGGRFLDAHKAVERAIRMVAEGADIVDIGGESSRPGAAPVSAEAEKRRVLPVIGALARKLDVPISIDTYRPETARAALDAGAEMINDIFGLRKKGMAELAAKKDVPVVIMHMKGSPHDMQKDPRYDDVLGEVHRFFRERIEAATQAGIDPEKIVLDPGIGFGKTPDHNLRILSRLGELGGLGMPVLVGVSRKSFIGKVIGTVVDERLEGGLAAATAATLNGATIIRAHDVEANVRAARIADAIMGAG